jgi:hypothetical protein
MERLSVAYELLRAVSTLYVQPSCESPVMYPPSQATAPGAALEKAPGFASNGTVFTGPVRRPGPCLPGQGLPGPCLPSPCLLGTTLCLTALVAGPLWRMLRFFLNGLSSAQVTETQVLGRRSAWCVVNMPNLSKSGDGGALPTGTYAHQCIATEIAGAFSINNWQSRHWPAAMGAVH